jgi:tetratricopeptide (TPR) repeat protein
MKIKQIIIASTLLVSVASFSQKDELKVLKKIYAKETPTADDLASFKSTVSKLETVAVEEADKVSAKFYKSMTPVMDANLLGANATPAQLMRIFTPTSVLELVNGLNATLDFEKKSGKKVYTDEINKTIATFSPLLVNAAVGYADAKKNKEASDLLYAIYLLDKKDGEKLYYAASYALNAQDYDAALKYYNELKNTNYTGEKTLYFAMNKEKKQEEFFTTKEQRQTFITIGTHEKPRDEKVPSKKGEIFKNIALILIHQGKSAEAKDAISDARKDDPNDTQLMLSEAEIYLKEKDFDNYTKIVNQALQSDPNNVDLVFNLGVISADSNKITEAENYYRKAIQMDPAYFNAYLNLAELKLRTDKEYVDEMKKLGTSDKDNKRFDELRTKQLANYNSVLPFLEKAVELKPDNEPAVNTLLGVYKALDLNDKYKALKAKLNK